MNRTNLSSEEEIAFQVVVAEVIFTEMQKQEDYE